MQYRKSLHIRPTFEHVIGDLMHTSHRLSLIGLIGQFGHAGTTLGVVPHGTHKQRHRPAGRVGRPGKGSVHRDGLVAELNPADRIRHDGQLGPDILPG